MGKERNGRGYDGRGEGVFPEYRPILERTLVSCFSAVITLPKKLTSRLEPVEWRMTSMQVEGRHARV